MPFVKAPVLPFNKRTEYTPKIVCGRRPNRKKGPAPVSTRVQGELPSLPDVPTRHASLAAAPPKTACATEIQSALSQRRDVLVHTERSFHPGALATVLSRRERTEHALVITNTRDAALIAAQEARLISKDDVPIIVAAGTRVPGAWRNPAMNANSSEKSVIVVATVRSLFNEFLTNGHGQTWFKKIRFLVVLDPAGILEVGAEKFFNRVLRVISPKERRKTVVLKRPCEDVILDRVNFLVNQVLRDKLKEVVWKDEDQYLVGESQVTGTLPDRNEPPDLHQQELLSVNVADHNGLADDNIEQSRFDGATSVSHVATSKPNSIAAESVEKGSESESAVLDKDVSGDTPKNETVSIHEQLMITDWATIYYTLRTMLQESETNKRTLVIFPTGRLVELYASMCRADGLTLQDLHKRTSSARRERILEWIFGTATGTVFSSDVVTSDVVLPQVDRVLQIGAPRSVKEYNRRVRLLSNGGTALLMIGQRESEVVVRELTESGHVLERCTEVGPSDVWQGEGVDMSARGRAYLSWISWWLLDRSRFGWVKRDVVDFVNRWAMDTFGEVPEVENRIVKKMPVRKMAGLRVKVRPPVPKIKVKQRKPVKKHMKRARPPVSQISEDTTT